MADAQGEKIGGGYVEIGADLSPFDAAMAALPKQAAAKMNAAIQPLRAEAAKTKIELGLAWKSGDLENAARAGDALQVIEAKIKSVEAATIKQGQAAQAAANEVKAAAAAATAQKEAQKVAAQEAIANAKAEAAARRELAQQIKQDAREQLAEQKRVVQQTAQAARESAQQAKLAARTEAAARRELSQQIKQDAREQLAEQRRVAQQYAQAERARLGAGAGGGNKGGGMGGAMGLMVLSQMVDDAQYGFKALVNQIPQAGTALASMFGRSAASAMKFGAIAGIAGVAVNYFINHVGEWANSLGLFSEETKKTAGEIEGLQLRIKTLEEKPIKLAIDTFEIDQAKKRIEELEAAAMAFKSMGETHSPGEKASGEAITKKFSELGVAKGDKIQTDLKAKMTQELISQSQKIKDAEAEEYRASEVQRKAEARMLSGGSQGAQMQAIKDVENAKARVKAAHDLAEAERRAITKDKGEAEQKIGKIWQDATNGVVDAQKQLIERLRAIGEESLAKDIEKMSPDLVETAKKKQAKESEKKFLELEMDMIRDRAADREREDSRLAGAMAGSVGQRYLNSPGMDVETMEGEVRKAMQKAGMGAKEIGEAVAGTAKKLRENIDKAVADRALERGIENGVARQQLAKEANALDDKQAGMPKSEVMSTGAYLNKLLVASLSKSDDPNNKALVAQQDTAKGVQKFVDLAEKWEARGIKVIGKDGPARVAPGR